MKILYVHGFGSRFDPDLPKVKELAKLGEVFGVDVDYSLSREDALRPVFVAARENDVDLIVGTSMGGYAAAEVGCSSGVPFVAVNPVTAPYNTLLDLGVDDNTTVTYRNFPLTGCCGLVLLDDGDEVLNSAATAGFLRHYYRVEVFHGGSHRFEHMKEALPVIEEFMNSAPFGYGIELE